MDRYEQAALLTALIDKMREQGSWAGETHIQKATYFLQHLLGVPIGFNFILYKHGPFSFDLRDCISTMRADQLIEVDVQPYPYGPRIATSELADAFRKAFHHSLDEFGERVNWIAAQLGKLRVSDLERLATGLFVTLQAPESPAASRAGELHRLKPHVSMPDALDAVRQVDRWREEVAH